MWFKHIYMAILDTLFPPRCPLCRSYTDEHGLFCAACYLKTVNVRKVPLDIRYIKNLRCVYILTNYHDGMKKIIYSLKYQKNVIYLSHVYNILQQKMPIEVLKQIDYFVPVPLHQHRLRERGFNQTEKIFYPWVNSNGLTWLDILERGKDTLPQYKLTLKERQQNMIKAFKIKDNINLQGKNILLLDDIFTTGVTMDTCAKVLKKAGAKNIFGLALASDA